MKTWVENRLLSPHNALNKPFTTNVSFLPMFAGRSVKTERVLAMTTQKKVKTERAEYRRLLNKILLMKKMTMREVNRYMALDQKFAR